MRLGYRDLQCRFIYVRHQIKSSGSQELSPRGILRSVRRRLCLIDYSPIRDSRFTVQRGSIVSKHGYLKNISSDVPVRHSGVRRMKGKGRPEGTSAPSVVIPAIAAHEFLFRQLHNFNLPRPFLVRSLQISDLLSAGWIHCLRRCVAYVHWFLILCCSAS